MNKNDKNILKKGLMKTNADFTSNLMNKIDAEEKALISVLHQHGSMDAPAGFTALVMHQLEGKVAATSYTPVISKKVWAGIAATVSAIILLVLFSDYNRPGQTELVENVENTMNRVSAVFTKGSLFMYLLIGILFFSIGLVIEQRVYSTRKVNND